MFLRAALFIHGEDLDNVVKCYDFISSLKYMHASPTLFNCGIKAAQLSSCFLLPANDDPDEIITTLYAAGKICRSGGGIGLGVHNVPATGYVQLFLV